jgi:hypothetical protein
MSEASDIGTVNQLASYRSGIEKLRNEWPAFLSRRRDRLQPHPLLGASAEKVTESILEDLLTNVLDWPLSSFNPQVEHADIVLTQLGIRRLIIETKRPETLSWNRAAITKALDQAVRYAAEQKVRSVAISDGTMFYAVDLEDGGLQDRVFISLDEETPPIELWWISSCGIYRPRDLNGQKLLRVLPEESIAPPESATAENNGEALLHPRYKLPARCFAFVPDASKPHTWKLPYLQLDGTVDAKRLPKAAQSILTNFRGTKVDIPEAAIPAVLERLATAARNAGRMPPACASPAPVYVELRAALEQLRITISPD